MVLKCTCDFDLFIGLFHHLFSGLSFEFLNRNIFFFFALLDFRLSPFFADFCVTYLSEVHTGVPWMQLPQEFITDPFVTLQMVWWRAVDVIWFWYCYRVIFPISQGFRLSFFFFFFFFFLILHSLVFALHIFSGQHFLDVLTDLFETLRMYLDIVYSYFVGIFIRLFLCHFCGVSDLVYSARTMCLQLFIEFSRDLIYVTSPTV